MGGIVGIGSERGEERRVPVAPRVRAVGDGEVLPLVYFVERMLEGKGSGRIVNVFGARGSGKSMALRYLKEVFGERIVVHDGYASRDRFAEVEKLVVMATEQRHAGATLVLELERWGEDDVIEYLLCEYQGECAAVMKRWKGSGWERLGGLPALIVIALEMFVRDEGLRDVATAIRAHVRKEVDDDAYQKKGGKSLWHLVTGGDVNQKVLVYSYVALLLLASDALAADLAAGEKKWLRGKLPAELVEETGRVLRWRPEVREVLESALKDEEMQRSAVSLLLAMDPEWRPTGVKLWRMRGARLAGAKWGGVDLGRSRLAGADFSGADLSGATLAGADLEGANLSGAKLARANLRGVEARGAKLASADLADADAKGADFKEADFSRARLKGTNLSEALLDHADLKEADLEEAVLRHASMTGTQIKGANFARADLSSARLLNVRVREGGFRQALFCDAKMHYCDLEYADLRTADFRGADFTGSYLTGSDLSGCNVRAARFSAAGLAEVEWEGADLRDADFTEASFHLGSSRSGLVGSALASEGTRTGFYTDDYYDQEFKAPEEIRKANLTGCDLRGATVEGTDFYLVDLRGAKYSEVQGRHFARCGAILRGRGEDRG